LKAKNMSVVQNALHWYDIGVTPLPVVTGTKKIAIPWRTYQTERPTRREVIKWFTWYPYWQNIALVCGAISNGLVVLDFDHGIDTYQQWQTMHPELADTYAVKTYKGAHAYLFCDDDLPQQVFMAGDDIEVRGWLCTMTAPSQHPNGTIYTALNNNPVQRIAKLANALGGQAESRVKEKGREDETPYSFPFTRQIDRRQPVSDTCSLVSQIKYRLPILTLLSTITRPYLSSSDKRWWIMRCPFHDDENPSFWVDSERDVCGCYVPECKAKQPGKQSMDVIDVYARLHKINTRRAIYRLAVELDIFESEE